MVEFAVELDTGRYTSSAAIILYVVRLVVRVEAFMLFLLQHNDWLRANRSDAQLNGTGPESLIRGLDVDAQKYRFLRRKRIQLRATLNDQV
jgi:hypothetical protein